MNGKGRPPLLTDELKRWITNRQAGLKKKLKVPALQNELRPVIEEQVRKEAVYKGCSDKLIQEEVEERLPGVSSIQKYLSEIDPDKVSFLDSPWHLASMLDSRIDSRRYIEPEALSYIFLVQGWLEEYPDIFKNPPPQAPLTIREALWIAQLRGMLNDLRLAKRKDLPTIAQFLLLWAKAYAQRERICELSGTPFDTSTLDKGIRMQGLPITINKTALIHYADRSLEIDTVDKDLLERINQIQKEGEK